MSLYRAAQRRQYICAAEVQRSMTVAPTETFTTIPEAFNVADYLVTRQVHGGRGDRIALISEGASLTYSELDALVNRAGNVLRSLGLAPEQRAVLLLHDGPAFYACFLGAIKIGAVPIPINTMLREADYRFILNDSRATVCIVSEPLAGQILPSLHLLPCLKHLIVSNGAIAGISSLETLIAGASPTLDPADTHKDDPAFWLYSSGSTGHAQRRDSSAARHRSHDRGLCARRAADDRRRSLSFGRETVLRVRSW